MALDVYRGGSPWAPADKESREYSSVRQLHPCEFLKWRLCYPRRREDRRTRRRKENEKHASAEAGCRAHLGGAECGKVFAVLIPDCQSCGPCLTVRLSAETQHYANTISLPTSCQPLVSSTSRSKITQQNNHSFARFGWSKTAYCDYRSHRLGSPWGALHCFSPLPRLRHHIDQNASRFRRTTHFP